MKAIETVYKGYKFRSRLESRWAVFFDSLNIPWVYEPEGIEINGIKYLPDFYLPDCKQFFEVKGVMSNDDERKINALMDAGYSVTIGYDDGHFIACDYWGEDNDTIQDIYSLAYNNGSALCHCKECGKYWFMGFGGIWHCQCCGVYDGDHHYEVVKDSMCIDGKWNSFIGEKSWNVARQARFEHGETPIL